MKTQSSRTVVITGAYSGFGREMVTEFLTNGWTVYAALRSVAERTKEFASELQRYGDRLKLVECDVTSSKDRDALVAVLRDQAGGLDCLINNAGFMALGALEDTDENQLRSQFETNFFAVALFSKALLPHLRERHGCIINVSSIFGFSTWPLTSVYCAAKYAVEGLTQSLRQELGPHGVRVALLEPGSFPTNLMDHLKWSESDASDYHEETYGYREYRAKLAARKKRRPREIARIALRIADGNNSRLHYQIGLGSKVTYRLVRLFPETFGATFMGWMARRSFLRAGKSS